LTPSIDGVVRQAVLLQEVQHQADVVVVLEHAGPVQVGLRGVFLRRVAPVVVEAGVEVHAAGVEPDEEGLALVLGLLHEVFGLGDDLAGVEVLHPLLGQRTSVLTPLLAHPAEARVLGRIIGVGGEAMQHAAGAELLFVFLEAAGVGLGEALVVALLGLFLGVQVVEVAEKLVEAVHRRQVLVAVAQVVLTELAGGVALRFHDLGEAR
jgi:hypothetical protein